VHERVAAMLRLQPEYSPSIAGQAYHRTMYNAWYKDYRNYGFVALIGEATNQRKGLDILCYGASKTHLSHPVSLGRCTHLARSRNTHRPNLILKLIGEQCNILGSSRSYTL
jgi:hypothetical protein